MYGDMICLDALRDVTVGTAKPYSGWSTSYSLETLLLQLVSFLLEWEAIPQDEKESKTGVASALRAEQDAIIKGLKEFKCVCGHSLATPKPWNDLTPLTPVKVDLPRSPRLDVVTPSPPPAPVEQPVGGGHSSGAGGLADDGQDGIDS